MDNETIKQRIRALLNKTVENGCTEAEAMIAAKKVAELLARYSISSSTIDITHCEYVGRDITKRSRSLLRAVIARVTNTYILRIDNQLNIYGVEPAPQVAEYLIDVCNRAIDREVKAFQQTTLYRRKRKKRSRQLLTRDFIQALVLRLRKKIDDLFAPNIDKSIQERVAQTVLKTAPFDIKSVIVPATHQINSFDAFNAGQAAADNIQIRFGINGDQPLALAKANEK